MRRWLRTEALIILESALVGVIFIQTLRYLGGML